MEENFKSLETTFKRYTLADYISNIYLPIQAKQDAMVEYERSERELELWLKSRRKDKYAPLN